MILSHGSLATTLSFQVNCSRKRRKTQIRRLHFDFWVRKKGAVHLIPSQNAFFYVLNESNVKLRKSESYHLGRRENENVSNVANLYAI